MKNYTLLVLDDNLDQARSDAETWRDIFISHQTVSLGEPILAQNVEEAKKRIDDGAIDFLIADYQTFANETSNEPSFIGHKAAEYALMNGVSVVALVSSIFNVIPGYEQIRDEEMAKLKQEIPGLQCFGRDERGSDDLVNYLVGDLK